MIFRHCHFKNIYKIEFKNNVKFQLDNNKKCCKIINIKNDFINYVKI